MGYEWKEFLELACFLAENKEYIEASKRSAVSRAYYSTFCYVRNYAKENFGFNPKNTAEDHRYLREYLRSIARKNKKYKKWTEIATYLDKLREERNNCDYSDTIIGDFDEIVREAIDCAKKIFKEIESENWNFNNFLQFKKLIKRAFSSTA